MVIRSRHASAEKEAAGASAGIEARDPAVVVVVGRRAVFLGSRGPSVCPWVPVAGLVKECCTQIARLILLVDNSLSTLTQPLGEDDQKVGRLTNRGGSCQNKQVYCSSSYRRGLNDAEKPASPPTINLLSFSVLHPQVLVTRGQAVLWWSLEGLRS